MKPGDFFANVDRFWAKVGRGQPHECWLWTGEVNSNGYGRFTLWHDGKRTRALVHRVSLILSGVRLEKADVVMHACDTPRCVNPAHLSVGTQLDNIRDALAKGRLNTDGLAIGWEMRREVGRRNARRKGDAA